MVWNFRVGPGFLTGNYATSFFTELEKLPILEQYLPLWHIFPTRPKIEILHDGAKQFFCCPGTDILSSPG